MARNVARAGRPGTPEEIAGVRGLPVVTRQPTGSKGTDIPVDGGMGGFNMADALGLAALTGGVA